MLHRLTRSLDVSSLTLLTLLICRLARYCILYLRYCTASQCRRAARLQRRYKIGRFPLVRARTKARQMNRDPAHQRRGDSSAKAREELRLPFQRNAAASTMQYAWKNKAPSRTLSYCTVHQKFFDHFATLSTSPKQAGLVGREAYIPLCMYVSGLPTYLSCVGLRY